MINATLNASWRIHCSDDVLEELETVMTARLGFSRRLARLTRERCRRRSTHAAAGQSQHAVPDDPADTPILQAAVHAGVDSLVT